MTMMGGSPNAAEAGESIASFPTYDAAQKAVSTLIAGDIPAKEIAIVGYGLRSIERVTGRLGYAAAARSGAINGVLIGLLFSAVFVLGNSSVPIQAFVGVLFVGIAVGMLFSLLTYAMVRRRRDYASVMQVVADHYDVTVRPDSIHRARQVIGAQAGAIPPRVPASTEQAAGAAPPAPPEQDATAWQAEPPRYGERITPEDDASAPGHVEAGQADRPGADDDGTAGGSGADSER
ncbi:general stress protein [Microbacterium rhizosphaerae]|uniref:General stress protein n=1 Tax=Microbacterium rhizosphaerae TaxID=1678237 RepID=A0ABZ0SKT3_9MICO|nr:general stress protein [Microbacterium rhizosphaerae]WPR88443.1 general stress protein [Microbacterium rhizosphaerae]